MEVFDLAAINRRQAVVDLQYKIFFVVCNSWHVISNNAYWFLVQVVLKYV